MAQRMQLVLEDDLDGGAAAETVSFALDGVSYEIDLNNKNAARLRDDLGTWIGHARRSGGRRSTSGRRAAATRSTSSRHDLSAVRAWARDRGHKVSDRGRVPSAILDEYDKAH